MCHVSHVTCHIFFIYFFFGRSGEAYRWRVCYQRGLPRLVFEAAGQEQYTALEIGLIFEKL